MALSNEFIITLQSIKGFGLATINKIYEASEGNNIFSLEDLYVLLKDSLNIKKLPDFDTLEIANQKAKAIISKSEGLGIGIISRYDSKFPQKLLLTVNELGKPAVPIILYYKGDLSITSKPSLAIIGTREPSEEGAKAASYFAESFAAYGINIVSGLAIGCDSEGHRGAISVNGATTAFLAHGLDTIYPKENEDLAQEILDKGGLLLSEYPIGTDVNKYNLVARDRLQSGLADATLVIQTGIKGGTMHAATTTLLANKTLFVVKYKDMTSEKVAGNIYLHSKGAKYITSIDVKETIATITNASSRDEHFKDTLF